LKRDLSVSSNDREEEGLSFTSDGGADGPKSYELPIDINERIDKMNKNLERLETKYNRKGLTKDARSGRRIVEGTRKSMIDMQDDFSDSIGND